MGDLFCQSGRILLKWCLLLASVFFLLFSGAFKLFSSLSYLILSLKEVRRRKFEVVSLTD